MSITYEEYNTKKRLPEQARDEKLLLEKKHFALCYEPGKGKSMPVIHCIREVNKMKGGKAKVLIMSDATCIKDMWKAEIVPMNILPSETYMVTDRSAIGKYKEVLLNTQWDIIVCDECQSLRSGVTRAKSQYAKLVYQLTKKTEYVWGMTGTISGNNDIEPFCVLHNLNIAGCGDVKCIIFKKRFCECKLQFGPFGSFETPVGLNKLGQAFMETAYENGCSFWDYDEDDDMPELDIELKTFNVDRTKEYENALEGIIKCNEYENTVIKSAAIRKAQQCLNGFMYYQEFDRQTYKLNNFINPKLKELINDCKNNIKLVAYFFQEDRAEIIKSFNDNNIKYTEDVGDFKKKISAGEKIILLMQCSRGKSFNLQDYCNDIIYYTSDFSFIAYKQMIHRCWRRGQSKPCRIKFLINEPVNDKDFVERRIWNALQRKQNIHELLMSIKNHEEV